MINDILYAPINDTENQDGETPYDIPYSDRKVIEYLLTVYRAGYDAKRLMLDLEGLSAAWEAAGRSCEWEGHRLTHDERFRWEVEREYARQERKRMLNRWTESLREKMEAVMLKPADGGKTETAANLYVPRPPVIPPEDDRIGYGFSE